MSDFSRSQPLERATFSVSSVINASLHHCFRTANVSSIYSAAQNETFGCWCASARSSSTLRRSLANVVSAASWFLHQAPFASCEAWQIAFCLLWTSVDSSTSCFLMIQIREPVISRIPVHGQTFYEVDQCLQPSNFWSIQAPPISFPYNDYLFPRRWIRPWTRA